MFTSILSYSPCEILSQRIDPSGTSIFGFGGLQDHVLREDVLREDICGKLFDEHSKRVHVLHEYLTNTEIKYCESCFADIKVPLHFSVFRKNKGDSCWIASHIQLQTSEFLRLVMKSSNNKEKIICSLCVYSNIKQINAHRCCMYHNVDDVFFVCVQLYWLSNTLKESLSVDVLSYLHTIMFV